MMPDKLKCLHMYVLPLNTEANINTENNSRRENGD